MFDGRRMYGLLWDTPFWIEHKYSSPHPLKTSLKSKWKYEKDIKLQEVKTNQGRQRRSKNCRRWKVEKKLVSD